MKSLRLRLFLGHLVLSAAIIGSAIAFVRLVWYPGALAHLEGIFDVLVVMAGVDVAAGPLCTLVAASPGKSRRELARDLSIIGAIQLLALGYALYTSAIARPVYLVYSFGQFEVEHARQLPEAERAQAAPGYTSLPWGGPQVVEARLPEDKEQADQIIISTARGGTALKDMPRYYLAWPSGSAEAQRRARKVSELWDKGKLRPAIGALLRGKGVDESDALILPLFGQAARGFVVLRRPDLQFLGTVPAMED
jgi:hypothetical protein